MIRGILLVASIALLAACQEQPQTIGSNAKVDASAFQTSLNDEADEALGNFHDVVESRVGYFRFHHPEFGEMAAGF